MKIQLIQKSRIFSVCAPPPPSTLCSPQLQSTCHYIVNHYVKILHVHLGVANNMHPLSWGGGTNGEDPKTLILCCIHNAPAPSAYQWSCEKILSLPKDIQDMKSALLSEHCGIIVTGEINFWHHDYETQTLDIFIELNLAQRHPNSARRRDRR